MSVAEVRCLPPECGGHRATRPPIGSVGRALGPWSLQPSHRTGGLRRPCRLELVLHAVRIPGSSLPGAIVGAYMQTVRARPLLGAVLCALIVVVAPLLLWSGGVDRRVRRLHGRWLSLAEARCAADVDDGEVVGKVPIRTRPSWRLASTAGIDRSKHPNPLWARWPRRHHGDVDHDANDPLDPRRPPDWGEWMCPDCGEDGAALLPTTGPARTAAQRSTDWRASPRPPCSRRRGCRWGR